jgi:hypothetical protein
MANYKNRELSNEGGVYMKVSDLLMHPIAPFEIEDKKMVKLFSFFLHFAPGIDSNISIKMDDVRLKRNWESFIESFDKATYRFLEASSPKAVSDYFEKAGISDSSELRRRASGFVCRRKNKDESDAVCTLRHIRNAIAHGHIWLLNAGNRKFVLFEDFNKENKKQARILFSQTELQNLKSQILK